MAKEQRLIDANNLIDDAEMNDTICKCEAGIVDVRCLIDSQPTVDAVEAIHGEWLDGCAIHNGKEVYKSIDCSVCEEVFKIESHDREYWKKRFKRCFCCGAFMDAERIIDG